MDAKESHKYASWCHANGITFFPVPTGKGGGTYIIAMNKNGNVKQGELIFKDKAEAGELSVWDKIRQLYKDIFDKNNTEQPEIK